MCVIDVNPDDPAVTIARGVTHNISTIERDLEMWEEVCKAQNDDIALQAVRTAHEALKTAYHIMLHQFGLQCRNGHRHA